VNIITPYKVPAHYRPARRRKPRASWLAQVPVSWLFVPLIGAVLAWLITRRG